MCAHVRDPSAARYWSVECNLNPHHELTLTPETIIKHGEVVDARHASIIHDDSNVDSDPRQHHRTVSIGNLAINNKFLFQPSRGE